MTTGRGAGLSLVLDGGLCLSGGGGGGSGEPEETASVDNERMV